MAKESLEEAVSICESLFPDLAVGLDTSLMLVKILNKYSYEVSQILEQLESHIDLPLFGSACVFCTRSKNYHLMGRYELAQDNLSAAKNIATEINASAESLLVRRINKAEQFLTQVK